MCVVLLIYTPKFILQHRVKMKPAYHMGYRLLSGIKNDCILKFSLGVEFICGSHSCGATLLEGIVGLDWANNIA